MSEYYFSVAIDNDRMLCISPLTDRHIATVDQQLSDSGGYFLYEKRGADHLGVIDVIAHLASEEAALRLREILRMS